MKNIAKISEIREVLSAFKPTGLKIALVPTMGNLHAGHLHLIEIAKQHADLVVVSIFVNPMQFGPQEDFTQYPRTLEQDLAELEKMNVDFAFCPGVGEMYPETLSQQTKIFVPEWSDILCGQFRPGHFAGVTTVVNKLFNIIRPDCAVFGQKDFQQLFLIQRMVYDLCMPIKILAAQTVRAHDGLALSSRNQYLSAEERVRAPCIYETLKQTAEAIISGNLNFKWLEENASHALNEKNFSLDYFSIRDRHSLQPANNETQNFVILTAAKLGSTRLIDNIIFNLREEISNE